MPKKISTILLALSALSIVAAPGAVTAQAKKNLQSGEISFEEDRPAKPPAVLARENAIKFAEDLSSKIDGLAGGSVSGVEIPNDSAVTHLAPTYLYCSINAGVCPFILNALLEADVINARIAKQPSCPTLERFWRFWLANDFEERHKYAVKTGFLNQTSEFKSKERPKYLQCKATVGKIIAGGGDDAAFFKARYADKSIQNDVKKLIGYLKELERKVPNLLGAVGSGK